MRRWLPALLLIAACGGQPVSGPDVSPAPRPSANPKPDPTPVATPAPSPSPSPTTPPTLSTKPAPVEQADPRWRFFSEDTARHASPWYAGRHRVMIGYGCTPAPYYDHDTRCPGSQGFHHGIDVAMPCGTRLTSAVRGVVLDPTSSGSPGAAYGENPFRIRTGNVEILIAHTRRVLVAPGDHVRPGQRIAFASDSGAPDGCHLHFEVRHQGGGPSEAIDPAPLLQLS